MRFSGLRVVNWRQFADINLVFDHQLSILTGLNGSGKSTLLSMMAGTGGYYESYVYIKDSEASDSPMFIGSLRLNDKNQINFMRTPITKNQPFDVLGYHYRGDEFRTPLTDILYVDSYMARFHKLASDIGDVLNLPLRDYMIYARKQNLHEVGRNNHVINDHNDISNVIAYSLYQMYKTSESADAGVLNHSQYTDFMHGLRKLMPAYLEFEGLAFYRAGVLIITRYGKFPLMGVSSGIQYIIELYWRLFMFRLQNKHFVALIDEPESHLHPEMQRLLLGQLVDLFPETQFIVATHSPLVVTSVRDASVFILKRNQEARITADKISANELAIDASDVLQDILGVQTTFPQWVLQEIEMEILQLEDRPISPELTHELRVRLKERGLAGFMGVALEMLHDRRSI